ncbi:hypothetical protein TSH58p_30110 (plasmid) [Azospirillum sp. TSH58]|uniref:hypothetical protein n=1 Tax=Azospirillum sp. TSH58 TaxID=664962 RepID=UPI000D601E4F|nr:hypothetical protein [Azospirillum sp. TSH58]AWJ87769.1 hypothetical protein TSH58p_30110 [Azospirillum sp. TSH58]PWC62128.1 hypothetical protein TSH58_25745 [Azospirillum sp. TSH58]
MVRLASNRWALSNNRPVDPAALADFGGVSEGRIRIPVIDALAWLATRKEDFWPPIWREQLLPQYGDRNRAPLDQVVFVPVAHDGSAFHPGLRRGAGYTVGAKGGGLVSQS